MSSTQFESPQARRLAKEAAEEREKGNRVAANTLERLARQEEDGYPAAVAWQVQQATSPLTERSSQCSG